MDAKTIERAAHDASVDALIKDAGLAYATRDEVFRRGFAQGVAFGRVSGLVGAVLTDITDADWKRGRDAVMEAVRDLAAARISTLDPIGVVIRGDGSQAIRMSITDVLQVGLRAIAEGGS